MRLLVSLLVMLIVSTAIFGVSIYDIQYTTVAGATSTYPSLLVNQVVSTEGIVSAVGFAGGKYAITEGPGPWKGIFVNDPGRNPQLGDRIAITGTVNEVSGFTEIGAVTSYSVIDSGNEIPASTPVTTADLQTFPNYTGEQYEGVLVKLSDIKVTLVYSNDIFYVTQVSGSTATCQIMDSFFPSDHNWSGVIVNQIWSEISGVVYYSSPNPPQYRVHPRDDNDMIPSADINAISLKLEDVEFKKGETKEVKAIISRTEESWELNKYRFTFSFNPRIARFVDIDIESTLSDVYPVVEISDNADAVTIMYQGTDPIISPNNNGLLLKLVFEAVSYGETVLDLTSARFYAADGDSVNASFLTDGKIRVPIIKRIAWLSIYRDELDKKNIFNPWLNEKITLEYGSMMVPGVASPKAIVRIYDAQGRLVATPFNGVIDTDTTSGYSVATGLRKTIWDGRDRNKNLLPIGVYYCHLEIIDRNTGHSETTVQPIVIASKLK
jgi:hypothetical protein